MNVPLVFHVFMWLICALLAIGAIALAIGVIAALFVVIQWILEEVLRL